MKLYACERNEPKLHTYTQSVNNYPPSCGKNKIHLEKKTAKPTVDRGPYLQANYTFFAPSVFFFCRHAWVVLSGSAAIYCRGIILDRLLKLARRPKSSFSQRMYTNEFEWGRGGGLINFLSRGKSNRRYYSCRRELVQ